MPSVTLNALLVDDQSLLRVCPPGRTLGNNIIGVTDIACGHNSKRPFAQGEKWILGLIDTASLNTTKKAWGGLIKTDHNVFAQGGIRAPLEAEDTIQAHAVSPPATESSSVPSGCDHLPPSRRDSMELSLDYLLSRCSHRSHCGGEVENGLEPA